MFERIFLNSKYELRWIMVSKLCLLSSVGISWTQNGRLDRSETVSYPQQINHNLTKTRYWHWKINVSTDLWSETGTSVSQSLTGHLWKAENSLTTLERWKTGMILESQDFLVHISKSSQDTFVKSHDSVIQFVHLWTNWVHIVLENEGMFL